MVEINNGAVLWARQTKESDIFYWKPPEWFKIWFYIVQEVNHKETKQFRRGEGYFNWKEIELNLRGTTRDQYNKCIKWLKQAEQITTRKTTRGNIIFVLNYDKFQTLDNYKGRAKSQANGRAGAEQGQSKSHTINKNDKNDKNDIGRFAPPTLNEVQEYCKERRNQVDPVRWLDFYSAKGWMIGKNKMKDWRAAVRTWERGEKSAMTEEEKLWGRKLN